MTSVMDELVEQILKEHKGGEKFFDNLDAAMRESNYFDMLLALIQEYHTHQPLILSGTFGKLLFNYMRPSKFEAILFNGGLRKSNFPQIIKGMGVILQDEEFFFVDDSFYSGKTRDAIAGVLARCNSVISNTFVLYDGSIARDEKVKSIYRYYK